MATMSGRTMSGRGGIASLLDKDGRLAVDITGNASTATKLEKLVKINGVVFSGDEDITITAGGLIIQPTSPEGDKEKLWINTTNGVASYWNGSAWLPIIGAWAEG